MRRSKCLSAISAGVILDGETAVLSFLPDDPTSDAETSILISRDLLRHLKRSVDAALKAEAALPDALALLRPKLFEDKAEPELCEA